MKLRNWLVFIFMVFLWSLNWSAMKIGLRYVTPFTFLMQRFALAAIVLLPFVLFWRSKLPRDKNTLIKLVILSLIFVSFMAAQTYGLVLESSGLVAVLVYTQPLFVFCLAVPLLKEKVTKTKFVGVSLGFLGVLTLFTNKVGSFTIGSAVALLSCAFLWAIAVIFYKRTLSHVNALVAQFFQLSFGVIPLLFLSLPENTSIIPVDILYLGILVFCSVGPLALGHAIYLLLLKEEEVTTVTGSNLLVPLVAMLFGWQLLGENLTVAMLFGSALTLGGVYVLNMTKKKPASRALKISGSP